MSRAASSVKGKRGAAPGAAERNAERAAERGSERGSAGSRAAAADLQDGWERFWFAPEPHDSLRVVRIGIGLAAVLYFASHWADIAYWFAADGMLSTERLGRLSGLTEASGAGRWHLTPLYWIGSSFGLRLVLGLGMVAALLTAAGLGGRWTVAIAWLTLLSVANRCWMVAGLAEIPLSFGLAALLIAGGGDHRRSWTTGLSRRLIEVHVSALVAAAALSQLAALVWWNGEGALHLVLAVDGPAIELTAIGNSPLFAAALTHAIVWLPILAVPLLWIPRMGSTSTAGNTAAGNTAAGFRIRRWAAMLLILHAVIVGGLSGHMLYGAANAVLLSLFLVPRGPRGPQHGEQR